MNEDGAFINQNAGVYNPLAAALYVYYGDGIIWPDGTTNIPPDGKETDDDCPFPDDEIEDSKKGLQIAYMACLVCMLI